MYQIPELLRIPKLFHAFSTKEEGNLANYILEQKLDNKEVFGNRKKFLRSLKIDTDNCICMWVVHDDNVLIANPGDAGISMRNVDFAVKTDGLITDKKGLYLFLLVADCLAIIFYDPVKEVVGLVHASWKGADLNIVGKAIRKLIRKYNSKPSDIIAAFGPAARKDSFIKESPSQKNDPKWQPYLQKIGNNVFKVDFVGLCKQQLLDSGINKNKIYDCGIDTVRDKRFFSHFKDKTKALKSQGRFACVVGITH